MINFCFVDKPGEATYIGNKKQPLVFHFLFKDTKVVIHSLVPPGQFNEPQADDYKQYYGLQLVAHAEKIETV
jgi:hypothetical protein